MRKFCFVLLALAPVLAVCQVTVENVQTGCPVEAVQIVPRVYAFRIYTADGKGWRPASKMALDLRIRNKSSRGIAVMSFEIDDAPTTPSVADESNNFLLARYDNVPLNVNAGDERSIYFPVNGGPLMDVYSTPYTSVSVFVTELRYANGEIVDLAACHLGYAPIPPPFKPVKPTSPSRIYPIGGNVSPPRVLEGHEMADQNDWRGPSTSVTLSCVVETDGLPQDIEVNSGTLGAKLDQEAIETLRSWYFAPAMMGDKPVATRILIQFKMGR